LLVVLVGIGLPYSPFGPPLGLTPLPLVYFGFLVVVVSIYLGLVEVVKHRIMQRLLEARVAHTPLR
jgi:Mg2+-importing ATPase